MRQDKIDDKKSIVNTLRKYCKYIKLKKAPEATCSERLLTLRIKSLFSFVRKEGK